MNGETIVLVPATKSVALLNGIAAKPKTYVTIEYMKATIMVRAR